jgi:AcrR family transcriptional regulator
MDVKSRREEYTEATRRALLDSAAALFEAKGYAATSVEEVVRGARVTRGALYHHFRSKQELFEAVYDELEGGIVDRVAATFGTHPDAWSQALAGVDIFLDACTEPRYHRIVLEEGPAALGYDRWRERNEHHSMGLVRAMLQILMDNGDIRRQPLDLVSRVVFSALTETGLAVAAADDREAARVQAGELSRRLLESLR